MADSSARRMPISGSLVRPELVGDGRRAISVEAVRLARRASGASAGEELLERGAELAAHGDVEREVERAVEQREQVVQVAELLVGRSEELVREARDHEQHALRRLGDREQQRDQREDQGDAMATADAVPLAHARGGRLRLAQRQDEEEGEEAEQQCADDLAADAVEREAELLERRLRELTIGPPSSRWCSSYCACPVLAVRLRRRAEHLGGRPTRYVMRQLGTMAASESATSAPSTCFVPRSEQQNLASRERLPMATTTQRNQAMATVNVLRTRSEIGARRTV